MPDSPKPDLEIFATDTTFANLGLDEPLLKSIDQMGFKHPTVVQSRLVPLAIEGRDILGQSRTGSGKTAAFGLPALQGRSRSDAFSVLILVPTRELAIQVCHELRELGRFTDLHSVPVYGGQKMPVQVEKLKKNPQIIVGTPGRVMDMHRRGHLPYDKVRLAILDEVDRMLDIGFREDIRRILGGMRQKHQTIFVSATISDEIERLARKYMQNPERLDVTASSGSLTVSQVAQQHLPVQGWDKNRLLHHLLTHEEPALTLIFCRTKATVDGLTRYLNRKGLDASAIHGDLQQSKRNQVMRKLRDGELSVLIASDLAARGIDVDNITHVINYDLPEDPEVYVHRIGRTARAGRNGIAWSFVTPEQGQLLSAIEALTNVEIPVKEYPDFKPGPEPDRVVKQRQEEQERTQKARLTHSRTRLDLPDSEKRAESDKFPGGIVPTGLPGKRLGGRIRTRRS
jgi:ATP-dependent RNA helicase DeaD